MQDDELKRTMLEKNLAILIDTSVKFFDGTVNGISIGTGRAVEEINKKAENASEKLRKAKERLFSYEVMEEKREESYRDQRFDLIVNSTVLIATVGVSSLFFLGLYFNINEGEKRRQAQIQEYYNKGFNSNTQTNYSKNVTNR